MSKMKVKLDENMAQTHVEFLQQAGYNADRVTDEGLSGADDDTVWEQVCAEERFFITLDLDFSDVRRFPPGTHPGILLLRSRNRSRQTVLEILSRVVQEQHERKVERLSCSSRRHTNANPAIAMRTFIGNQEYS